MMYGLLYNEEGYELSKKGGGEDCQDFHSAVTVRERQTGFLFL